MKHLLAQELFKYNQKLTKMIKSFPSEQSTPIVTGFFKKNTSIPQILSYLTGWSGMLINWYEDGKNNDSFIMPGEGFDKWEYDKISQHFFKKYNKQTLEQLLKSLNDNYNKIIKIIEDEAETGNLNKPKIWSWCTLNSGKDWPLEKWIRVNSLAPLKRAISKIQTQM